MARLPDQADRDRIRTDLDHNIVVEAAAGTGKTTELVHRIVAVLAAGRTTVDRLVAVTFTEKAAGELKLHLRTRLESARQQADDAVGRTHLEAALARLEEARVGTIHAFCADLLRERSLEAGVDPRFEPLDETEAARLFRRAFDAWFETALQQPPEGLRRALRRTTQPRFDNSRNAARARPPAADDGPVGRLRSACWALAEQRDCDAAWQRPPFARSERIATVLRTLHEFAALSARCDKPDKDLFYLDTRELRQCSADIAAAEAVAPRDDDGLEALFVDLADRRDTPRKGFGKLFGTGVGRDAVHQAHAQLRDALRQFARDANADLAALLQVEFQQVLSRYREHKEKTGRLDFTDLLLRARDLLRDCDTVRTEFQLRFTHVFVDEFQDTDPLQAEILLLLAARAPDVTDWRQTVPAPGKLFLVGDPKQSIYRFRGADIGIYFEVRDLLVRHGARCLQLRTSFRAVSNIQHAVNAAFAPCMTGDRTSQQADYVPLAPVRQDPDAQPTLVALPVPRPFGRQRLAKSAIELSLPGAVATFVQWLLDHSGWTVGDREQPDRRVPIAARHVCLLLRRFDSFAGDVTRGYVRALEARDIPHLLVGGRSYHEREEVETLRAALNAIEWPDDELSVFATLHGSLFAIGDDELLEFRQRCGRLHPLRLPAAPTAATPALRPVAEALALLAALHRERNERPVAETLHVLLEATRAHAGFALRPSGDQVLANVLHLSEQARAYERGGGISFRGFVERLEEDAERRTAAEAPILEETSDGVRIMTVHKAKGLEFPVVILADITAHLTSREPARWLDRSRRLCAQKLCGWSPAELLAHADEERARETSEGIRIAYVAATRARDLLVVPAVGSEPWGVVRPPVAPGDDAPAPLAYEGWVAPLNTALYPPHDLWAKSAPAPGCPRFGTASVVDAPFDRALDDNVRPGLHRLGRAVARAAPAAPPGGAPTRVAGAIARAEHAVVWWDPALLAADVPPNLGLRQQELLHKDVDAAVVQGDVAAHRAWLEAHAATLDRAATPRQRVQTTTARAHAAAALGPAADVEVVALPIAADRPRGPRFGTLVHAVLGTIPLTADAALVGRTVDMHARVVGAPPAEAAAAAAVVIRLLQQPLLEQARAADARGDCRREAPVTMVDADGTLVEGIVDLAFLLDGTWVVVDFKTDHDLEPLLPVYTRQVALYAAAVAGATQQPARAVVLRI